MIDIGTIMTVTEFGEFKVLFDDGDSLILPYHHLKPPVREKNRQIEREKEIERVRKRRDLYSFFFLF